MLKYRRHAVGPSIIGGTLIGGAYCSGIAALAAVNLGTADPVVWIIALARRNFGTVIVSLILLMNIPTICMLIYFAAVSTIATYCGVQFIGISAIGMVDFYLLRRRSIALHQLFNSSPDGHYWFWHGVNLVAIGVIVFVQHRVVPISV